MYSPTADNSITSGQGGLSDGSPESERRLHEIIQRVSAAFVGTSGQKVCVNCGRSRYEHFDHNHDYLVATYGGPCPFRDCDQYVSS